MDKAQATNLATSHHIPLGRDFFTLRHDEVCRVLEAANLVKYRKPKHANGSRGRYFYAYLNRAAIRP